eukprot:GILK01015107.1.p2 GENE.GILK01015107.1~~GILK01015107.1.p2  ORF type:complete len:157 (-),score=4.19 GILK01015107.1:1226-1696(-)
MQPYAMRPTKQEKRKKPKSIAAHQKRENMLFTYKNLFHITSKCHDFCHLAMCISIFVLRKSLRLGKDICFVHFRSCEVDRLCYLETDWTTTGTQIKHGVRDIRPAVILKTTHFGVRWYLDRPFFHHGRCTSFPVGNVFCGCDNGPMVTLNMKQQDW